LLALRLQELARKRRKIPLEDYSDGPQGLKFYGEQPAAVLRIMIML
jgi:hypothetical protein